MISKLTNVKVVDSSGAGWVQCFHIYRGFKRRYAGIGDFIKGAIKKIAFYPKYRRGKRYKPLRLGFVVRGLVVQTKKSIRFWDNTRCRFFQNSTVLLKRRGALKSKFIPGPLSRKVGKRQYESMFGAVV